MMVQHDCFDEFDNVLSNPIKDGGYGEKFVAERTREHYNSPHKFNKILIHLIGDQTIALARCSYRLIDIMKKSDVFDYQLIKILAKAKICEKLRRIGVLMNQISVDDTTNDELEECCMLYFNLFSIFFNHACNSTVWTIGYVVPYTMLKNYTKYIKLGMASYPNTLP